MGATLSVIEKRATLLDFGLIERKIADRERADVSRSLAFSHLVLETEFGLTPGTTVEHIVDGGNDRGIDIVYIDHDRGQIHLGSCKTVISYKNSRKSFPGDEIDKLISFVDDLLYRREAIFDGVNGALAAKIREIWEVWSEDPYPINVHLFSNQATLAKNERQRLTESLARSRARLFEHGLYELAHGVVRAARPTFRKRVTPIAPNAFFVQENGHRGMITRISLGALASLVSVDASGAFDDRLIHGNIRYFLGHENEVNKEIRATLLSGKAHDFWFLNAGITIVCDQIITIDNGCHPITLVNPQIVNGCQTATVVHEVATTALIPNLEGSLGVKIIETSDAGFIDRIAFASNNQSRVYGRDLRANDAIQTRLAETLRTSGYFYRRKRGEVQTYPGANIIDAARAGQLLLAYLCGEPTKSKTDSNDVFGELYLEAFNPNATTAELIVSAHLCHTAIEARRQKAIAWQKSLARNSFEESWIIEGHFHVLFVVGELLRRRCISLESSRDAIELIDDAIDVVQQFVAHNPKVSSYRLFRLATSKEELLKLVDAANAKATGAPLQLPLPLFDSALKSARP